MFRQKFLLLLSLILVSNIWSVEPLQITKLGTVYSHDAVEWHNFKIAGVQFITGRNVILKWDNASESFLHYQTLNDSGSTVYHSKTFFIGDSIFLAVPDYNASSSKIYKWNPVTTQFDTHQSIPTTGAYAWEYFQTGTQHYLALVGHYSQSTGYDIPIKFYAWSETTEEFQHITGQDIAFSGGIDCHAFEINGVTHIAIAGTYNTEGIQVYRFDGLQFTKVQGFNGHQYTDCETFEINGVTYLGVCFYSDSGYGTNSKLYKWVPSNSEFVLSQDIAVTFAYDMHYFEINGHLYLGVIKHWDGSSRNTTSTIYRWDSSSFVVDTTVSTNNGHYWNHILINNQNYLVGSDELFTINSTNPPVSEPKDVTTTDGTGNYIVKFKNDNGDIENSIMYQDTSSQNIGVATTNPLYKLDVNGSLYGDSIVSGGDVSASSFTLNGDTITEWPGSENNILLTTAEQINLTNAQLADGTTPWTAKENAVTAGTTADYYRGDKTWQTLDKNAVGLGNVPNTNIAYSTPIAADQFNATEVTNLKANTLADGSTPWTTPGDAIWSEGANDAAYYSQGNVGIGTDTPKQKLDVDGNINLSENNAIYFNGSRTIAYDSLKNVSFGADALQQPTGGSNIGLGYNAGKNTTTGHSNAFLGWRAGFWNSTGYHNVAIGNQSLHSSNGHNNIALGFASGYGVTGIVNVFMGYKSGYLNKGNSSVGIGEQVLMYAEGGNDIAIGSGALRNHKNYGYNVALGSASMGSHVTGWGNVSLGAHAGRYVAEGSTNVILGTYAGTGSTSGNNFGDNNTLVGSYAGYNLQGDFNTIIGHKSGYLNTGTSNVFIGYGAGYNETGSNRLYIDNTGTTEPLLYGEFDNDYLKINGNLEADAITLGGVTKTAWPSIPEVNLTTGEQNNLKANTLADGTAPWTDKENTVTAGTTTDYYRGDKTWQTLDKNAVGLGNVPNTDIAYSSPIAADQFVATEVTNLKANTLADGTTPWTAKEDTVAAGTTADYYRGDKTWQTLDKNAVGLGNVPNTDIAYSSPIAADQFVATEVTNLKANTLADGTTPWTAKEDTVAAGTTNDYYRGDKTWQTLDKNAVGLGNVPNTDIAYSSPIAADQFVATEVSNLKANTLADGTTPWTAFDQIWTREANNSINYVSGNIGIGNNNPQEKLHVEDSILIDSFQEYTTGRGLFFREGFSDSNKYNLSIMTYNDGDGTPDALEINGWDGVYFNTGSNSRNVRMAITNTGNVGIGTENPSTKLDVSGTIKGTDVSGTSFTLNGNTITAWPTIPNVSLTDTQQTNLAANKLANGTTPWDAFEQIWTKNGSDIGLATGNVGIGTTSPTKKLHLYGTSFSDGLVLDSGSSQTDSMNIEFRTSASTHWNIDQYGSNPDLRIYTEDNATDGGGQMHLTINGSNGNVGIGTTTPSEKLEVSGNIKATGTIQGDIKLNAISALPTCDAQMAGAIKYVAGPTNGQFYGCRIHNSVYEWSQLNM
jgi:hypothetical protein